MDGWVGSCRVISWTPNSHLLEPCGQTSRHFFGDSSSSSYASFDPAKELGVQETYIWARQETIHFNVWAGRLFGFQVQNSLDFGSWACSLHILFVCFHLFAFIRVRCRCCFLYAWFTSQDSKWEQASRDCTTDAGSHRILGSPWLKRRQGWGNLQAPTCSGDQAWPHCEGPSCVKAVNKKSL